MVVNSAIVMWNCTFGTETSLLYPSSVASALSRLSSVSEIVLPTFPIVHEYEVSMSSS